MWLVAFWWSRSEGNSGLRTVTENLTFASVQKLIPISKPKLKIMSISSLNNNLFLLSQAEKIILILHLKLEKIIVTLHLKLKK